jgi:hypothetical protein
MSAVRAGIREKQSFLKQFDALLEAATLRQVRRHSAAPICHPQHGPSRARSGTGSSQCRASCSRLAKLLCAAGARGSSRCCTTDREGQAAACIRASCSDRAWMTGLPGFRNAASHSWPAVIECGPCHAGACAHAQGALREPVFLLTGSHQAASRTARSAQASKPMLASTTRRACCASHCRGHRQPWRVNGEGP